MTENDEKWIGRILGFAIGFACAIVLVAWADYARGDDRMPGEWLDDNQEYGEAIVSLPDGPTIISTRDNLSSRDVEILFTRCLEFLRDGDVDQSVSVQYSVYRPHTLKSDAYDTVEAAHEALDYIERETQLRRDIEKALAALRGEK